MGRISGLRKKRSGAIAAKRLKLLLITDKTGVDPELLDMLKADLCGVVSRYMDVNADEVEVMVKNRSYRENSGLFQVLCLQLPIKSLKCKGIL